MCLEAWDKRKSEGLKAVTGQAGGKGESKVRFFQERELSTLSEVWSSKIKGPSESGFGNLALVWQRWKRVVSVQWSKKP